MPIMRLIRTAAGRADTFAFFAGLLLPLAFAPFRLFPLAIIAPALLFLSWRDATPGRAAWRGFLFGFGMFGVGVSWIYVSMHNFGNMAAPLAAVAVLLFVSGLALYPALFGFVQTKFRSEHSTRHYVLVLPALWVAFEWLRGWFLTGFPWLNLGYSQLATPLSGYAPWLGVYGVTAACALLAGLLACAWTMRARAWRYLALMVTVVVGGAVASWPQWVQPSGGDIRVALVQGNIPLAVKWQPQQRDAIAERYLHLTQTAPVSDLVVWPEAAIPNYLDVVTPTLLPRVMQLAAERKVDFLIGVVERDAATQTYYNSVVQVGATGPTPTYRKQHLVPFGEFLPVPGLFSSFIKYMQIPMSNFDRGAAGQVRLHAAGQPIGVSVCYEDAFGEELIQALPQATVLVNVSEDAWFGHSLAPHQRIEMARMRALESGRPMLRAANTGPSVIVDHRGNLIARSPQFVPYVLTGSVTPTHGATPYARFGNVPIVALVAAMTMLAGWFRFRGAQKLARSIP